MRYGTGVLLCLVVALAWASGVRADDYIGATGGNYNVGANWSGGTVPDIDDSAYVRNGATVTMDAAEPNVVELMVGHPGGDPNAVNGSALHILSGASLTASQTVRAGGSFTGTVIQSGGLIAGSGLNVASGGGAAGQYTLSGGTLMTDYTTAPGGTGSTMNIGSGGGSGVFTQTGGYLSLINSTYLHVGNGTGSYGQLTMTNGTISVGNDQFNVGTTAGQGTFNMSGGVVTTGYKFQIGYRGDGVVNQSGGTVYHNPGTGRENLTVGQCDTQTTVPSLGIYNLSGGLLDVNRRIYIGSKYDNVTTNSPGVGRLNVSGGSLLNLVEYTSVGYKGGQGTLSISGTGYAQFRKLNVADSFEVAIPAGWVNVSGGLLSTGDGGFTLGRNGPGYMNVTGGSVLAGYTTTTVSMRIGESDPNAEAILNISGGVVTAPYQLDMGYQEGRGTINLSGTGRLEVGGDTIISRECVLANSGGRGEVNMSGGSFQGNIVYVGYRGSVSPGVNAKLNITGGTFRAAQVRLLSETASGMGTASLKIGANADVALVDWFMIQQNGASVEMQIASATKYSKIVTTGSVDLGTNLATLALNSTGYRPKEGDKFTLLTAVYTMTGSFSSIGSNITLGLPGASAFSGAIVTDPNTAEDFYVATFLGYTAGDANGDHIVDGGDLALMGGAWMQSGQNWGHADFTGDGLVDGGDLALIGGNWMWQLPPAPEAPLPEPATLALLSVGVLAVIRRKR